MNSRQALFHTPAFVNYLKYGGHENSCNLGGQYSCTICLMAATLRNAANANVIKPMKIYEKIMAGRIRYPIHFGQQLRSLLRKGLLQGDLTQRLGNLKDGVDDIRYHPWFDDIDWMAVYLKRLKAPIRIEPPQPVTTDANRGSDQSEEEAFGAEEPIATAEEELFGEEFAQF